ncbi:aldo/keto reductase [Verrucomicrobiota bacterium]
MLKRKFGKTGWQVGTIGLGTWNIGNQWGELDDATAEATIHKAIDCGMNLIDTAESYGEPHGLSELRLGKALANRRDDVYIVTKVGSWGGRSGQTVPLTTPDMIRLCAHSCLGRMKTDRLDVVLCHQGGIKDPSVFIEGFKKLQDEGSIREYGVSTNDVEVLKKFNADGKCAVAEVSYSLVSREPESDILPYCAENNIGVLIRGPLSRGLLAGKYDRSTVFTDSIRERWNEGGNGRDDFEQRMAGVDKVRQTLGPDENMLTAALRYVISHESAPVAIPGAKSPEQAEMNAAAGEPMSAGELEKWRDA